eukprot:SAG31_NODE_5326_length_2609_cov_1.490837_2_plen_107_part_00
MALANALLVLNQAVCRRLLLNKPEMAEVLETAYHLAFQSQKRRNFQANHHFQWQVGGKESQVQLGVAELIVDDGISRAGSDGTASVVDDGEAYVMIDSSLIYLPAC